MFKFYRFCNWISSAIHQTDDKAIVTVGSWTHYSQCDSMTVGENEFNKYPFNHFKPECLVTAGGKEDGTMDFWQFHTYPSEGHWDFGSPFSNHPASDYDYDLPVVLGEFPTEVWEQVNHGLPLPGDETTKDLVCPITDIEFFLDKITYVV